MALVFNPFTGTFDFTQSLSALDSRYVNISGDTMTGDLSLTYAASGSTAFYKVTNSSNNAASHAALHAIVTNNASDPKIIFEHSGGSVWSIGMDNDNDDKLTFSASSGVGTSWGMTIDTGGAVEIVGGLVVDTDSLIVNATSNKVGVNVTTPDADLHVMANSGDTHSLDVGQTGASRMVWEIVTNSSAENVYFEAVKKGSGLRDFFLRASNVYFDLKGTFSNYAMFVDGTNNRVGIGNTAPNNALDVTGTAQIDGLRLDVSPTAETITPSHTITISVNGTNYKIPIVAA